MKNRGKEVGLFILIVLLVAISYKINPRVLNGDNLTNLGRSLGMYGIMSLGMAFVIITSGIDLSVGSAVALLGVGMSYMLVDMHLPIWMAVILTVVFGALLGYGNGAVITRIKMQPFVVTLCGLLMFRGFARFISGDSTRNFGSGTGFQDLKGLVAGDVFGIPSPLIILAFLSVIGYLVLHKSIYGRHLFAAGFNEESARYAGINSKRVITAAYVICGVTTGIAAILFAIYTNSVSPSTHGNIYELYAIAAAVLGGCSLRGGEGSIVGVLLGTTLIVLLRNLVNMLQIPSSLEYAVIGGVIFIGVLADTVLRSKSKKAVG
ncbi:MAG TPA: ABC transporter permease [Fimbriimonas sp.]|nr:ABC transporter permease [Fimbriimonas sp.]